MKIAKLFSFNYPNKDRRDLRLDFIRGFGMLLVLIQHSNILNIWILSFHMPFFFILSGYTAANLSKKPDNFWSYTKNRFVKLIVPYLCFELINLLIVYLYKIVSGSGMSILYALRNILLCLNTDEYTEIGRLWFLPCMFICDIVVFFILKIAKEIWSNGVFALLFFAMSYCLKMLVPFRLPFTADTAIMATGFVLLGYAFRDLISYILNNRKIIIDALIAVALGAIYVLLILNCNTKMHMFENKYGDYTVSIAAAIVGSFICFVVVKYLYALLQFKPFKACNNLILWYGFHSLAVFPVHLQIRWFSWLVLSLFAKVSGIILANNVSVLLIMLVMCVPVINFINRFMPFLLGKRLKKS